MENINHQINARILTITLLFALAGCGGADPASKKTNINAGNDTDLDDKAISHLITTVTDPNGSIDPVSISVDDSSSATFSLVPDPGYSIQEVSGCSGSIAGSTYTTAPLTSDCSINVTFATKVGGHILIANASTGGVITPQHISVDHGESASFGVIPNANNMISSVTGCGGILAENIYTINAVDEDCYITATFIQTTPPPEEAGFSREINNPVDEYSFSKIETLVSNIRNEGHTPLTGHPKIYIRSDNKVELASKIKNYHLAEFQEMVDFVDAVFGQNGGMQLGSADEPNAQPAILINGMIYQLGEIAGINYHGRSTLDYGFEGVRHMMSMLDYKYSRNRYVGVPIGYDWLYDLLTTSQRIQIASHLLDLSHPSNNSIFEWNHPPGIKLLGALAIYGDEQLFSADLVQKYLNLFHGGYVFGDSGRDDLHSDLSLPENLPSDLFVGSDPNMSANFITNPEGPGHEGIGYSHRYYIFAHFLLAWRDQTGEDYFQLPFFQNWPQHYTHMTGNSYEFLDKYQSEKNKAWSQGDHVFTENFELFELALSDSNPAMAGLLKHHRKQNKSRSMTDRVVYLLLNKPNLSPQSPLDLNISRTAHFEVVNNIFARNAWTGTESTWMWFQSPTWSNIRNLGPVNDLVLWKNGGMLLAKHQQSHDYDGGNRTNTLVLYDESYPNETFIPLDVMDRSWNRPGVNLKNGASVTEFNADNISHHKGLRYFEELNGEYLYVSGDEDGDFQGTKGDNTNSVYFVKTANTLKIDNWNRQVVWFRNDNNTDIDVFFVFDRVKKPSDTITSQIPLHFFSNPSIRNKDTNEDLGSGTQEHSGVWKYDFGNRIVATNNVTTEHGTSNGRLFVDTLLPHNPQYFRMGGIDERNVDLFGNLRTQKLQTSGTEDDPSNIIKGLYRVQIGGQAKGQYETYLNIMQATDTSIDEPHNTTLLEGVNVVGAIVNNNIALFNSIESNLTTGSLTIPDGFNALYRIIITDLVPNEQYMISTGNISQCIEASEQGTFFVRDMHIQTNDVISLNVSSDPC